LDFALSAGEERFRELMDAVPVAVYTTDAQGRLTYFNPAAVKLAGRTPKLGTDCWCVTWKIFLSDGTALPHDQCPMAIALKGGEVSRGLVWLAERPDGTRLWFSPYPAVLRDPHGRITGGVNVLVDITARKTAQMESEQQFRAMFETTPECVKVVAPDGTLIHMNPSGLAMVSASSAEAVVGKSVYDLIAPADRERYRQFNERICRGEKGTLEFDIIGLDGVRRRMETHAAPLRHFGGLTFQIATTRDVTERTRAESAAWLLKAVVDSSDDAIISKDLNGTITSWNKSAERIFGYSASEAIGKSVLMIIPQDRQEEEVNILSRLRRGDRIDHFATVRRRKDGTLLDISLTISPVKDARGTIIGASKIARDISERKREQSVVMTRDGL
jgi:PAS domain S-box-containing protein